MDVRFKRRYGQIIDDLMVAIRTIGDFHEIFDMDAENWAALEKEEQDECVRAVSNDIFYGLGAEPVIHVGQGIVEYDRENNYIKIFDGTNCTHVINLM